MNAATIERDDLAHLEAMMQRPKERGDDPWFDWKLPPYVPGVTVPPRPDVTFPPDETRFPPGTILRPVSAWPRSVDAFGVTWWRCWYEEVNRG